MATKEVGLQVVQSGDVLVNTADARGTAMKVLSTFYLPESGSTEVIVEMGDVWDNKFQTWSPSGIKDVQLRSHSKLVKSFGFKWTPDKVTINSGDVLKDADGHLYLVQSKDVLWRLDTGTYAGLDYWEQANGKLTQTKSANGEVFSKSFNVMSKLSW